MTASRRTDLQACHWFIAFRLDTDFDERKILDGNGNTVGSWRFQ